MKPKPRKSLFDRLQTGLQEAIAHARGELTLKTVDLPDPPPEIDARTLSSLRNDAAMSQAVFASVLSTSTKTVQSWEQGKRVPSMAARRLIQVFVERPEAVCQVIGLQPVHLQGYVIRKIGKGRRQLVKVRQ